MEPAQDVVLDAEVHHHDARPRSLNRRLRRRPLLGPGVRARARHAIDQGQTFHLGRAARLLDQRIGIEVHRREAAAHHAAIAQVPRERARVDARDSRHAAGLQQIAQPARRAPVARVIAELATHHRLRAQPVALEVFLVDPVVAQQGIREGDDLSAVRGIAQHLLIARHGGVEDHLSRRLRPRPAGLAAKHATVFERQDRRWPPRHRPTSTVTAAAS